MGSASGVFKVAKEEKKKMAASQPWKARTQF